MAYISVTDAVARTGKGQTTIYRLCRKHEHTNYVRREDKKFLIDEDFLAEHYAPESANGQEGEKDHEPARQELVDLFIQELLDEKRYYQQLLDRKDEQLVKKDAIILGLQDRQREMMNLLERYSELLEVTRKPAPAPPAAPAPKPEPVAVTVNVPEPQSLPREEVKRYKNDTTRKKVDEAKTVYTVLAVVGFLLLLAIIFVDELRGLAN